MIREAPCFGCYFFAGLQGPAAARRVRSGRWKIKRWFAEHGFELVSKLMFEVEGDAHLSGDVLYCGYKHRSDIRSHLRLAARANA